MINSDINIYMLKLDCKISSRTIFISSNHSDITMYFLKLYHIIPNPHIFSYFALTGLPSFWLFFSGELLVFFLRAHPTPLFGSLFEIWLFLFTVIQIFHSMCKFFVQLVILSQSCRSYSMSSGLLITKYGNLLQTYKLWLFSLRQ